MEINYKKCDYEELLKIIDDSRKELYNRGTVTTFEVVNIKE